MEKYGSKVQGSTVQDWGSGFKVQGYGFRVQRHRRPKKRPVKSKKETDEHRTSNSPEASKHLSASGRSNIE